MDHQDKITIDRHKTPYDTQIGSLPDVSDEELEAAACSVFGDSTGGCCGTVDTPTTDSDC